MAWITENKEWLFSGAAVTLIGWLISWFITRDKRIRKTNKRSYNKKIMSATTTGNNSPVVENVEVQSGGVGVQIVHGDNIRNDITKVEKEIANTEESIEARCAAIKNITLYKSDIDTKIITVKNKDASIRMLAILLDDVPIRNSIRISTDKGDISPSQIFQVFNLIVIRMDLGARLFFLYHTNSCHIQYVPKNTAKHSLVKFTDVEMFFNENNVFKIKPLTKELESIMASEFQYEK